MDSQIADVEDYLEFRIWGQENKVEINLGQSFGLSKVEEKIQFNTTPQGDATLVPMEEIKVDDRSLLFIATTRTKKRSYKINFAACPFGHSVASFIKRFAQSKLKIQSDLKNELHFRWDSGNIYLSFGAIAHRLSIFIPQRRATHLYRRQDGILRPDHYVQCDFAFKGNQIEVSGDLEDRASRHQLSWSMNFQEELSPFVVELIQICMAFQSEPHENSLAAADTLPIETANDMHENESEKSRLERLIAQEKVVGRYVFDESKRCFFANAEVGLYITKEGEESYRLVFYFIDGYEVVLHGEEVRHFEGDEESAKKQAINSFNRGTFLGYPILFENITCDIYENEA